MYQNTFWTFDKLTRVCVIVILLCIVVKVAQNDSFSTEKFNENESLHKNLPPCMQRESVYQERALNNFGSYDGVSPFEEYFDPNQPKVGGIRGQCMKEGTTRIGRMVF